VAYLKSAGKDPADIQFEGRSDFSSFTLAGVAAGGIFTGAEEKMTLEQAERWGGEAGQPFDPNYHKAGDTIENIDQTALEINGRGVAYAVGLYAQDQRGRNGVPLREDRTRHVLES
jgi:Zn-dependent M28 family amino/carboxypeptidase